MTETTTTEKDDLGYSAIGDAAQRIKRYYGTVDLEGSPEFDAKDVGAGLRERWIRLCETLQLPFRVTVLKCENPEYVVILSQYSLFEGVSTEVEDGKRKAEYVEIRRKELEQHTFVWVAKNKKGGEVTLSEIYMDKFYTRVPPKMLLRGTKKPRLCIVPICWVVGSDGQFEHLEDKIRVSLDKLTPTQANIRMIRDILAATIAEETLGVLEIVIQELDNVLKKLKNKEKIDEARIKAILAQAFRDLRMAGKPIEVGMSTRFVSLISTKATQLIGFIALLYIGLSFIINMIALGAGMPVPWGFPNWTPAPVEPEPGGTPEDFTGDGTGMILTGILWFLRGFL